MKILEINKEGYTVYFLKGDIDMDNSHRLLEDFDELIKRNETKVLMDFSAVTYINSSGLAALVEMFHRLKDIHGQMRFCGMNQSVRNVFEITRLTKLFENDNAHENAPEDV